MRAIITEYTGTGYTAKTEGHQTRVATEHSMNVDENHIRAAQALIRKIDGAAFFGQWVGGDLGGGKMAWVTVGSHGPSFQIEAI